MGNLFNPAAGLTLDITETEVFNGAPPGTSAWTDLDLSAVTGAKKTKVLLKVQHAYGGVSSIWFRQKGETEVVQNLVDVCANMIDSNANQAGYVVCITNAAGFIQWYFERTSGNVIIDVIEYLN